MPKTTFKNGDDLLSTFLNLIFRHKHDGTDEDGHCEKIDLATEVQGTLPLANLETIPYPSQFLVGTISINAGIIPESETWFPCDGRELSRTDYAELFACIGIEYGTGDETTTFNIPNLSGRSVVGTGTLQGGEEYPLGRTDGEEKVELTRSNLPGEMMYNTGVDQDNWNSGEGTEKRITDVNGLTNSDQSNVPHENRSPFIAMNFIIKAK